jgi:hypothetical protein
MKRFWYSQNAKKRNEIKVFGGPKTGCILAKVMESSKSGKVTGFGHEARIFRLC